MPLFDTHAHYQDNAFRQDRRELLEALPAAGVEAVVVPGVDVESSRAALALAEEWFSGFLRDQISFSRMGLSELLK